MAAPTASKNFSALTALATGPADTDELFILDSNESTPTNKPKRTTFAVFKTGLTYPGGTDVAVVDGGTGASNTVDARVNLELDFPVTNDSGATYNLLLADAFTTINITVASTVVIPANSVTPFPIGTEINVVQGGTGAITFSCPTDTLNINANLTAVTNGAYAVAGIKKMATLEWVLFGNLVAA